MYLINIQYYCAYTTIYKYVTNYFKWYILQTTKGAIKYDDIVAVINHLNQLIKLLLLDVQSAKSNNQSRCLEYFLNNQLLGKLYSWSLKTDRYVYNY